MTITTVLFIVVILLWVAVVAMMFLLFLIRKKLEAEISFLEETIEIMSENINSQINKMLNQDK